MQIRTGRNRENQIRLYRSFTPVRPKNFTFKGNPNYFERPPIRGVVAACIARLKAVLDTDKNIAPVGERIEFKFVRDTSLRTILERDYIEIQKAFIAECWKSVVILAGGSIEAILLDRLSQDEAKARSAKCAPSDSDLSRWDLSDLIKVAIELKIVEASAGMLTDAIRQYRNLIHPGYELRNKMSIDRLEAHGGLNILNIVHRDLSR